MQKILSIIGAVAVGAVATWMYQSKPAVPPPPPAPPLVAVEQVGHLVSVKVNYANVLEFTDKITQDIPWTNWELRFGGGKVLLVARGDCLVGTDLRQAKYQAIDEVKRTAVLVLPRPMLMSARVSHEPKDKGGSYFFAMTGTGIEPIIPGSGSRTKAIDAALTKAEQDIGRVCGAADVLATARKNAEAVLTPLLAASQWHVSVQWAP